MSESLMAIVKKDAVFRIKRALKQADGKKLIFAELRKRAQISRGVVEILDGMKQSLTVDYELDDKGMMAEETVISLVGPEWLKAERGEELFESMFETAELPEIDSKDLEPGTYTNRQIAEKFDDPAELIEVLMSLPGNSPASNRSVLSVYVKKMESDKTT